MFARLENIKLGKMFEDETTNINDVEKALSLVNIKIRDTETSFRPMGDVFDEISQKWDTMNQLEQSAVANAIAGVRQRENFLTLMRNYSEVMRAQSLETDAAGLSQSRYRIYLDNVEAATNRLTAAWEKLVTNTTNSGFIKWMIDLGTTLLNAVDSIGIFNIIIIALSGLITTKLAIVIPELTAFIYELAVASGVAAGAATTLSLALAGGLAGIGIVILIAALGELNKNIVDTYENFSKLKLESDKNQKELTDLATEYEKLANKQNKNSEDIIRLLDIQTILNTKYEDLTKGVNFYSDAVEGNTQKIKENAAALRKAAEEESGRFLERNKFAYEDAKKFLEKPAINPSTTEYLTPEDRIKLLDTQIEKGYDIFGTLRRNRDVLYEQVDAAKKLIIEYEHYLNLTKQSKAPTPESIDDENIDRLAALRKQLSETELPNFELLQKQLLEAQDELVSVNNSMLDLISNYEKYGEVGLEEVSKLREAFGEKYIDALYVENDQIKINVDVLKQLMIAKAKDVLVTAQQILAADQYNEALIKQVEIAQAYLNQLESGAFFAAPSTKNQEEAYQELLKITINMIKQQKNAEKEALREQLENYKEMIDSKIDALEKMAKKEKQRLQDQLDGYKAIIEAEINLINKKRDAEKHADEVSEKNKEIADIDAQLLALQFDNSEAANAKRLELEAERAEKTKELTNIQTEYSVEQQTNALEEELEAFEKENKAKQEIIERNLENQKEALEAEYKAFQKTIEAKIEAIENYLSQAGTINAEAMALLSNRTAGFYESLLEWNRIYGESVDQYIIDKWLSAFGLINSLSSAGLPTGSSTTTEGGGGGGRVTYMYHDGGIVGDKPKIKETEIYAKLLKGEVVANESQISQFINKTLPNLISRGGETGVNMPVTIKVMGNLDKSVLPDLKNVMLEVVNTALRNRGIKRDAFSYSL